MKALTIKSHDNREAIFFLPPGWNDMAPVTKVLKIHEQCREITHGKPFEIMGER